jgi:hypothetical protein
MASPPFRFVQSDGYNIHDRGTCLLPFNHKVCKSDFQKLLWNAIVQMLCEVVALNPCSISIMGGFTAHNKVAALGALLIEMPKVLSR